MLKINKNYKIAILGAGYVGLDLAIALSKKFRIICFDISKVRIQKLKIGVDFNKQYKKCEIVNKNLYFTNNINLIKNLDYYIVTVPTPINKLKNPDLSMLKSASKMLGNLIKKDSTIIYESTTFPGCTEEICIPIVEKFSNLKFKEHFNVAYSPERVNPGDKINTLRSITKIIGANDSKTLSKVKKIYKKICGSIHPVSSIKIAESAKVIENIQRDINIAFVNELSVLFNKLNIPTNDVLNAASTKWNFHYYNPGLVGGHCISVDPYYLAYKAKTKNFLTKLILAGRKINESMGRYVATQTIKLLKTHNVNINNSRIAILGFAFKDNIPDIRNTKIIQILDNFKKKKIFFHVFDPLVNKKEVKKEYNIIIRNMKDLKKFKYDVIILAVSHKIFLKKLSFYSQFYVNKEKKIFIDVKNNYSKKELKKNNYKYFQL